MVQMQSHAVRHVISTGRLVALVGIAVAASVSTTGVRSAAAGTTATDGPGAVSHQDLSRKDCIGTARNTRSKIWFTVADGVLSDVYAPTVDATNVETMQYVVTDGSSFTDLQTRDMTYTATADPSGMVCTVTSTPASKAYRLISTYLTDPARDSVVVHTRYVPLTSAARSYQLYVRLDANAGGNGGGGTFERRRRLGGGRHLDRLAAAGVVRHQHHQPGRPRVRRPVVPGAAGRPTVHGGEQWLRR